MKSILQLNLQNENEKVQAANVPRPESEETKQPQAAPSKRLSKFVNRAAHKGALHSSRGGSGIFTK